MTPEREAGLRALAARLGHAFGDLAALDRALTHKSWSHEQPASAAGHNEQLEFLGDAVLGLCVTILLHEHDPEGSEGGKSRARAELVSAGTLARKAESLGLPLLLMLGRGEEKTGGRNKRALWTNAYEAVVAALFLDGGFGVTEAFLRREFGPEVSSGAYLDRADHKSALQEVLQARGEPPPSYTVVAEDGPSHAKSFRVACVVGGATLSEGEGSSKKSAEQEAARGALEGLHGQPEGR